MDALENAIKRLGGVTALAEVLNVKQPVVSNWKARKRVPAEFCRLIEEATEGHVTRYALRPDIFGPAPDAESLRQEAA